MRNIILYDTSHWSHLLPLTYTRPLGALRVGILTIAEKWEKVLNAQVHYATQEYLIDQFPLHIEDDNWLIPGNLLPDSSLIEAIQSLPSGQSIHIEGGGDISRMKGDQVASWWKVMHQSQLSNPIKPSTQRNLIQFTWDLVRLQQQEIRNDFQLLTTGRKSAAIPQSVQTFGSDIFLEPGAQVHASILNATTGPIYIGTDAEVMEGCMIRGPFGLGDYSQLKMGAKIYPGVSTGPHCKVGGECGNSILQGFSNKGHDGYLGDSVLGNWCNLGADTNVSNLKNTYAEVKMWDYPSGRFIPSGMQFLGLIMGDHSKCGINTMFNTGTVVGVAANIFGEGYPRNFVPSFSWGGAIGWKTYRLEEAIETAERVMTRRNLSMTETDKAVFNYIFTKDGLWRTWEK